MSAPSWLRPEVTSPSLRPAPTQPPLTSRVMPGVATSSCLTDVGGGGLLGRHRGGADEHAVDGHGRLAVGGGPVAGEVVDGALRRTDAAADADDQVVDAAQVGVRRQQQLVEVLPRVVSPRDATLDVGDDRGLDLRAMASDLADLLDRAGLEHDVADARPRGGPR